MKDQAAPVNAPVNTMSIIEINKEINKQRVKQRVFNMKTGCFFALCRDISILLNAGSELCGVLREGSQVLKIFRIFKVSELARVCA